MARRVIQVEERVPWLEALPLSLQHLFAMFGASVLVPYLFNQAARQAAGDPNLVVVDPALVLLMNGVGTLIYLVLCKGRAPAFLGSSFAFIAPTIAVLTAGGADFHANFSRALGGFIAAGMIFALAAAMIAWAGTRWLDIVLPPAAMGPIVALIGLELGKVAAGMAGLLPDANGARVPADMAIGLTTLALAIFGSLLFRGFLAVIPILLAVLGGYALAFVLGRVDLAGVAAEQVFSFPRFTGPLFDPTAILVITPAALVVLSEHIGHLFVTGNIVGRDLTRDPGLHRSLAGDGISTMLSGLVGSVPVTTYGENMGVMAITRVYSVWVIGGAAVISIAISFIKVLSNLLSTIPVPVMGGISMLLFGVIAASGIRMLVEAQVDYNRARNLILTAMVFMVGISEVSLQVGAVALKGMALATLTGMALSLVFHVLERLHLLEEEPRRPAPTRSSADAAPRRPELV